MPPIAIRLAFPAALVLALACDRPAPDAKPVHQSPAAAAAELLAADSAFSATGADSTVVASLSAMFAPEVTLPGLNGQFAVGVPAAAELLRTNPINATGRATWTPVRVGLSADGLHGFTFGYGVTAVADSQVPWKYLSYWVKGPSGWRVMVYRRGRRAAGDVSLARMNPVLPAQLVSVDGQAPDTGFAASLDRAERSFSDEAQQIGLGPAFAKWGRADAVNMGGPQAASFVVGAEAIGAAVGQGDTGPSPVVWAPDRVIVAASGDLGVTIGLIRRNGVSADQPGMPFFTVWYRASVSEPWRYIAE